jgi:hypothetical protein
MDHHRDRPVDVEARVVGGASGREACEGVFAFSVWPLRMCH